MHMWDESVAKRGACEVASCLKSCLEERCTGAKRLIFYSDGCSGQNKNRILLAFFLRLIQSNSYESIDHKFLVRGHTYLPNDRDFSSIEARKRVEKAFIPSDWVRIVRESRVKNPFIVNHCTQEIFENHKDSTTSLKTRFTDQNNETLNFRDVVWFSYGESEEYNCTTGKMDYVSHKNDVWCRYTYSTLEPWKKVKCFKRGRSNLPQPSQLYNGPVPIKPAKCNDLIKLCENHLRPEYQDFYFSLSIQGSVEENDDEMDFELQ